MTPPSIADEVNRIVTDDELRHALEGEITLEERDEFRTLFHWFTRRYPTPESRLAYVRQAYARWRRHAKPEFSRRASGDNEQRR